MDKKSKIWLVVCIVIIVLAIGITVAVALINRNPKINLNNEFSSDKIHLENANYRNYDEFSNYNSRRLTTTSIKRRGNLKTNSIWSNINKDLLLQKMKAILILLSNYFC